MQLLPTVNDSVGRIHRSGALTPSPRAVGATSTLAVSHIPESNIKPNSKLLANLDSVFFTIDLNRGLIFNADSLPKDTKITKLVPNIGTSGSSKIELIIVSGV